eukprot:1253012-Rhodomonas_salina.6
MSGTDSDTPGTRLWDLLPTYAPSRQILALTSRMGRPQDAHTHFKHFGWAILALLKRRPVLSLRMVLRGLDRRQLEPAPTSYGLCRRYYHLPPSSPQAIVACTGHGIS